MAFLSTPRQQVGCRSGSRDAVAGERVDEAQTRAPRYAGPVAEWSDPTVPEDPVPLLADATATLAAWAATAVVLLLIGLVLWSFLRRRGTVDGLTVESPADAVRRDRLAAAEADPDAAPTALAADATDGPDSGIPEQGGTA